MKVDLEHIKRVRALQVVFVVFVISANLTTILASGNNGEYYSIVEEHQSCDHIIPKFIEQIMKQETPDCKEPGVFPKPGNCSVFFKCAQSDTMIQPFIEYCTVGYNFVNNVCVPNTNSSDCPQYTCRIPDGANELDNEFEVNREANNNGNSFQSLPLVVPPPSSPATTEIQEPASSTTSETVLEMDMTSRNNSDTTQENAVPDTLLTEMQMTQTQDKSSVSSITHDTISFVFCLAFAQLL